MAFAFNDGQLREALDSLGVNNVSEYTTVFNSGAIVRKSDAKALVEMIKRHNMEMKEAMKNKEFAEAAFLCEMDNHEYAINWDGDTDVLSCFGFKTKDLEDLGLIMDAYRKAREEHMRKAHEEWGLI